LLPTAPEATQQSDTPPSPRPGCRCTSPTRTRQAERGSNENLNRIVREFFPKGVTITSAPHYLATVASEINDRPRKIHNWKKPSELFTELVEAHASTA
jgi:hypothetical protein